MEKWLPDLTERHIPLTSGFLPLDMLADESSKVHCTGAVPIACVANMPRCLVYVLSKRVLLMDADCMHVTHILVQGSDESDSCDCI